MEKFFRNSGVKKVNLSFADRHALADFERNEVDDVLRFAVCS